MHYESWGAFYHSEIQSPLLLLIVPSLFWLYLALAAPPARTRAQQFMRRWALLFSVETMLDPIATGPLTSALGLTGLMGLEANSAVQDQTRGGHWPQWRGPDRTGVSRDTGLLTSWPTGGPKEVWSASGLGQGFSSVAIDSGRILTMGDRRDGQYAIAIEDDTGREVWSRRLGSVHRDQYAGPRGTPTIDGDRTYVLTTDGDLVCLETASRHQCLDPVYGETVSQ